MSKAEADLQTDLYKLCPISRNRFLWRTQLSRVNLSTPKVYHHVIETLLRMTFGNGSSAVQLVHSCGWIWWKKTWWPGTWAEWREWDLSLFMISTPAVLSGYGPSRPFVPLEDRQLWRWSTTHGIQTKESRTLGWEVWQKQSDSLYFVCGLKNICEEISRAIS